MKTSHFNEHLLTPLLDKILKEEKKDMFIDE